MSALDILYFGPVEAAKAKGIYSASTILDDRTINLDLNFEQSTVDEGLAPRINDFLQKIAQFDKSHLVAIREDYKADGDALDYIRFFLDEFRERELIRLLGGREENKSLPVQLLDRLQLERVGVYPDDADGFFAVFDYVVDLHGQAGSQVLAVITDEQGKVDYISWES